MSLETWLPGLVAGLVALTAPLYVRPLLARRAVLDIPSDRSSHSRPVLRGGGVAQLLAVGAALVVVLSLSSFAWRDGQALVVVLIGGLAFGVIGLVDDVSGDNGPGVMTRAGLQLLVAMILSALLMGAAGAPWTVAGAGLFIAAYVNAANFMDGVNWISGLHGLVVGVAFALIGRHAEMSWLVGVGVITAAAYLAFLPWNVLGSGMFMGDVGSYLLGGLIAGTTVAGLIGRVPALVMLSPLAIYLADTAATLMRRITRGEPVLRAHRTHTYQRLTDTGFSHGSAALTVALLTALTSTMGLLYMNGLWPFWLAGGGILAVCACYVSLPSLLGDRLPPPNALLEQLPDAVPVPATPDFSPRTWAIVGASGFIGSALTAHLRTAGLDVVELAAPRLNLAPATASGAAVLRAAAASSATADLAEQLRGVEVVVNAAGLATPDAFPSADLYGANSLLPAVVGIAANSAGVRRFVHLSSAAVQGRRLVLDESTEVSPFSAYSRAKALGESAVLAAAHELSGLEIIIVRATSVQGDGRATTDALRRIACSPLASVAAPGTAPSAVSSLAGLVSFVACVGRSSAPLPGVALQPWEGESVAGVLKRYSGREPRRLPRVLCTCVLWLAWLAGRVVPEIAGLARRLEMMWMGQEQVTSEVCGGRSAQRSEYQNT